MTWTSFFQFYSRSNECLDDISPDKVETITSHVLRVSYSNFRYVIKRLNNLHELDRWDLVDDIFRRYFKLDLNDDEQCRNEETDFEF